MCVCAVPCIECIATAFKSQSQVVKHILQREKNQQRNIYIGIGTNQLNATMTFRILGPLGSFVCVLGKKTYDSI